MGKKRKEPKVKGKKTRNKRPTSKKWDLYKKGNSFCPRCGPGVFLAEHENRSSCGKCGYTVFKEKK